MENEIGGTYGRCGRQKGYIQGFGGQTYRKESTCKTLVRWEDNISDYLQEVETWTGSG
jgi:hypothetical protein